MTDCSENAGALKYCIKLPLGYVYIRYVGSKNE
jgi:hypothetical protein